MKSLIKDGNLTGFGCTLFFGAGIGLLFLTVQYSGNYTIKMVGISLGLSLMAVGGYAAKAAALHLRPFGKSPWRIAKETYEDSDEDAPESKESLSEDQRGERKQSPKRDPRNDD